MEEYFTPFHLQIETSSTDDLDEELLMQKVHLLSYMLTMIWNREVGGAGARWFINIAMALSQVSQC